MKISFLVVNLGCGGVERTVTYLSEYFANQGEDVSIICISDEQFYDISDKVQLIKFNIPSKANSMIERIRNIFVRYTRIWSTINELKPDCLVCLDAELIRYIYWQHKLGKFKLITSERNNPLVDSYRKKKTKIKSFRNSDGIVFQTARARNCFPTDIANKGIIIPNAVGNEFVYKVGEISVRRKVLTAAGRLTYQKDYPTMLRAFSIFKNSHPDYKLEIYGKGEDLDSLKALSQQLELDDNVVFKGAVKDAISPISTSSCYVMSSIHEGMPNALMEAMAVGVPCISTDCPFGPRELIIDEQDGLLVPVGDVNALAKAMLRMIDDREFAERCASSARKILQRQSISSVSEQYLSYIRSILHE